MSTPKKRPVNFPNLLSRGQHYAKTWPLNKHLTPVFIENRIIHTTCYTIRMIPPIVIFTLCWRVTLGGWPGPAVATTLSALSLSMQGLWWLGKRLMTPLPSSTLNWSYEMRGELQETGQALTPVEDKPDYQVLADTSKRVFKQLDKTLLNDL